MISDYQKVWSGIVRVLAGKLGRFDFRLVPSRHLCNVTSMAVGESGRIVIDVDPEVKRRLYSALAISGSTLKDWFLKNALSFCEEADQPLLLPNSVGRNIQRGIPGSAKK